MVEVQICAAFLANAADNCCVRTVFSAPSGQQFVAHPHTFGSYASVRFPTTTASIRHLPVSTVIRTAGSMARCAQFVLVCANQWDLTAARDPRAPGVCRSRPIRLPGPSSAPVVRHDITAMPRRNGEMSDRKSTPLSRRAVTVVIRTVVPIPAASFMVTGDDAKAAIKRPGGSPSTRTRTSSPAGSMCRLHGSECV